VKAHWIDVDRTKTWQIVDNGEVISKHISLWHAQTAAERKLKEKKITNKYEIVPMKGGLKE